MKVAIPHWQGRVSPVFDVASNLLLVELHNSTEQGRQDLRLDAEEPQERVRRLADLEADVLICGAISWALELALLHTGIEVIPQTCGEVEQVLAAFIEGQLKKDAFLMPGCGRRPRGRPRRVRMQKQAYRDSTGPLRGHKT